MYKYSFVSFIKANPDANVCFDESKWSDFTLDLFYLRAKIKSDPDSLKHLLDFLDDKTNPDHGGDHEVCFSGSDFSGSLKDMLSLKYFVDKNLVKLALNQVKAAGRMRVIS